MWKWFVDWIQGWFKKQEPEKPKVEDEIDISGAVIHTAPDEVKTWPITVTIKRCWLDNLFRWEEDPRRPWKDVNGCNACIWLFRKLSDGKWHGGPGDYARTNQSYKNKGDVRFENGNTLEQPSENEEVGILVTTICRHNVLRNGKERTQVKRFVWKKG